MTSGSLSRPRLVFLRPHETLSEYEMNYVRLLDGEFALRVVTVGNAAIGGGDTIPGLIRRKWPDEFSWKGRRRSLMNAVYARLFKRRYHIPALAPLVAHADFVQANEAASEVSYQAARLKERFGFKLLLSASENQPILEGRSRAHEDRIRYVIERVDHAFAIPAEARDRLIEAGLSPEKITVIGHGIDCDRFSPEGREEHDGFRVGFCGRFRREKGLRYLCEAAGRAGVELFLLGEGPDGENLKAVAPPGTTFLPPLPYSAIHTFYKKIDLFVLPSIPMQGLVEQFGFVLLDAMASGVPIVASAIGGIPGVVGDAAILVPPADVLALTAAIEKLKNDPQLYSRYRQLGLERVHRFFRREQVAEKMASVYRKLSA